jgi:hypothetical protein
MQRFLSVGLAVVVLAVCAAEARSENKKAKATGLEMLKRLAGEWTGKALMHGDCGHDAKVTYKVTGGGSAVVETLFPGTEHEMVTVYHQDGADLVLTHYCMLHNQPRMRARGNSGAKLEFKFAGASNLKSEKDPHMHDMTLEFVNDHHIKATWSLYKDGKLANKAVFDLRRVKK